MLARKLPSIHKGYARNAGESEYPESWKNLYAAYAMGMQGTGKIIYDFTHYENLGDNNSNKWSASPYGLVPLFIGSSSEYIGGSGIDLANIEFTIATRFYRSSSVNNQVVFSSGNSNVTRKNLNLRCVDNSENFLFGLWNDDLSVTLNSYTGRWTSVTCTLNSSFLKQVFQDGVFIDSSTGGGLYSGATNWNIGRLSRADAFPFNGLIAEVLIYRKVSNDDEIKLLHEVPYAPFVRRRRIYGFTTDGSQTLIASSVGSAEAFGSHTLAPGPVSALPSGIASIEAFGSNQLNLSANPSGISSAESFGSLSLSLGAISVLPGGVASLESFGSHTLIQDAVFLQPTGIASAESFGSHLLALSISPSSIASLEAFGNPLLTLYLLPNAIATAEAFGSPGINLILSPSSISSIEAFGSLSFSLGAISVLPGGIASIEAFGSTTVSQGVTFLSPGGIGSAEAFGTSSFSLGAISVLPSGLASAEAFGSHSLVPGLISVLPNAISSLEAHGSTSLVQGIAFIQPGSIASLEAFGTLSFSLGGISILPSAAASAEAFGTATLQLYLILSGIASAEAFGSHSLALGAASILPVGISSAEIFGATRILLNNQNVDIIGVISSEGFGTSLVSVWPTAGLDKIIATSRDFS